MASPKFNYTYNPLSYDDAQKQVAGQLDPLFNRAIQNVNQAKYQNDVQAGQVAAARGLGHSGLAADQLNKIAIAAQGQIGDLNAQRATQLAQMANDLVWRDKEYSLQDRSQKYNEFNSNRSYDYQVGRDSIADKRYKTEWDYQVGRDKTADKQWKTQFDYQKGRDKVNDDWRQKEWSQMSPAEKTRMQMEFSYNQRLKKSSGGGGGGGRRGRRSSGSRSSSGSSTGQNRSIPTKSQGSYNTPLDQYAQYQSGIYTPIPKVSVSPNVERYLPPPKVARNQSLTAWQQKKLLGL